MAIKDFTFGANTTSGNLREGKDLIQVAHSQVLSCRRQMRSLHEFHDVVTFFVTLGAASAFLVLGQLLQHKGWLSPVTARKLVSLPNPLIYKIHNKLFYPLSVVWGTAEVWREMLLPLSSSFVELSSTSSLSVKLQILFTLVY